MEQAHDEGMTDTGAAPRQAGELHLRARRSDAIPNIARRLVSRQAIDRVIDLVRLRIDTFPRGLYQPVADLPVRTSTRAEGCESRWRAMLPMIQRIRPRTGLDLGANAGYFSLQLAALGVTTIAVESEPGSQRTAMLAIRRSGLHNVGLLAAALSPDALDLIPPAECVLFLSLWHHVVREHGLAMAGDVLRAIWARTGRVLFFDTGEDEMPPEFRLPPMTPDARTWLEARLRADCPGGRVEHLGLHRAFDAEGRPCERNFFAVLRDSAA